jgi:HPt (histidine-containing phosphotransfer) domain-containing protein
MSLAEDKYEYIDLGYILEIADGDEDFVAHMLDAYLVSIPENIDKLVAAADVGDCKRVLFCAHTLKGSFNFIGSTAIADMLGTLERICYEPQQKAGIPGLVAEIVLLAGKATAEVTSILKKLKNK